MIDDFKFDQVDYYKKALVHNIEQAKTIRRLKEVISRIPEPIQGSKQEYTPKELVKLIDAVVAGKKNIMVLTKTFDIRKKVHDLMQGNVPSSKAPPTRAPNLGRKSSKQEMRDEYDLAEDAQRAKDRDEQMQNEQEAFIQWMLVAG